MSVPSKPIPIPSTSSSHNDHANQQQQLREAEHYDAATWRMFDLITSARLRAASRYYYSHCHGPSSGVTVNGCGNDRRDDVAIRGVDSQQQRLDGTRQEHEGVYPSIEPPALPPLSTSYLMEVFPMESP